MQCSWHLLDTLGHTVFSMFRVRHVRDFGAVFEKENTLRHTHMYVQYMYSVHVCCDILWSNREVLVLGAQQQLTSSSHAHTVQCDLHSARNWASSSLQHSSGHRTGLHVQYAADFSLFFFLLCFFLLFSTLPDCFWLADPTRNIEKNSVALLYIYCGEKASRNNTLWRVRSYKTLCNRVFYTTESNA